MLKNLRAEMARAGISTGDLAKCVNKTDKSMREKISGKYPMGLEEAFAIRNAFFPGMTMEYLFANEASETAS